MAAVLWETFANTAAAAPQPLAVSAGIILPPTLQVRFGVLNAGNFGVSQSRKRTFIWAAAPTELLPEWPRPKHVFRSVQLASQHQNTTFVPYSLDFGAVLQSCKKQSLSNRKLSPNTKLIVLFRTNQNSCH